MTARLHRAEWFALTAASVVAVGFLLHQVWYPSSLYDAGQYAEMGRQIVDHGIFSRFMVSQVRTYGYPAFLSLIDLLAGEGLPTTVLLFAVQCGAYIGAAVLLRQALMRWSPRVARVVFIGLLLNYYALLYTPECLTESLSLTALIVLGAGWLEAYRRRGPLGLLAALSLVAGFAAMIRPANIFMTFGWLVGTLLIGFRSRLGARRTLIAALAVAACVSLPFIPQLAYNVHHFGRWTALLARDLGQRQRAWGIQDLKYATAMPPSPDSAVHYVNPWLRGTVLDDEAPVQWYVANPGRAALTLAVHSFNLTDQDLLFTYSRDLAPWYRVPLGIINHAAVVLGLMGLALCAFRATRAGDVSVRDAVALLCVVFAAAWALHVWTAVEMRFGLPLLCVLFPAAVYALSALARSNIRKIAVTAVVVVAYVGGALRLSAWVRDQSPLIQAVVSDRHHQGRLDDADGDGVLDAVDQCPGAYAASPNGCSVPAPRSGDWNGAGDPQLVFVNGDGRAYAWTLRDGAYVAGRSLWDLDDPGWSIVGTSDLTGDGHADILWQNRQTGVLRLFAMLHYAKVAEPTVLPQVGDLNWRVAATGDFNGDGEADIMWQHLQTGNIAIWFIRAINGQPIFQTTAYVIDDAGAVTVGDSWRVAGASDFDGDGHRDVLLEHTTTGDIKVWNLGARTTRGVPLVRETSVGGVGHDWKMRAVGDFSGDGRDDWVFQNASTGQLSLWVRSGDGFARISLPNSPPAIGELAGPR